MFGFPDWNQTVAVLTGQVQEIDFKPETPEEAPDYQFFLADNLPCQSLEGFRGSSSVTAVAYCLSAQEFSVQWESTGRAYKYFRVPLEKWEDLLNHSESLGRWLNRQILRKYGCVEIDPLV